MLAGASRAVRRWLYSGGCTPDCATGASARGCAAAGVRPSLALWPPRVAAVQVTLAVARLNTTIVWVGDSLTPVVLAGRRRVGQRLAHQVQHGPCAVVWPAQARRRRALAVSRAPPGPPPRAEPCLQLGPGVRAGGKRGRFFLFRIFLKDSLGSSSPEVSLSDERCGIGNA